jgi:hypothetical protein
MAWGRLLWPSVPVDQEIDPSIAARIPLFVGEYGERNLDNFLEFACNLPKMSYDDDCD